MIPHLQVPVAVEIHARPPEHLQVVDDDLSVRYIAGTARGDIVVTVTTIDTETGEVTEFEARGPLDATMRLRRPLHHETCLSEALRSALLLRGAEPTADQARAMGRELASWARGEAESRL